METHGRTPGALLLLGVPEGVEKLPGGVEEEGFLLVRDLGEEDEMQG